MKRLYRSRSDRYLAGICGGMGEYFQIDSTVIRLVFVFFLIATGIVPLLLAYLLAILIIPVEPVRQISSPRRTFYRSSENRMIAGICGALAERWDVDPTVVRLIAIFTCFVTGIIPLAAVYAAGWILIPEK